MSGFAFSEADTSPASTPPIESVAVIDLRRFSTQARWARSMAGENDGGHPIQMAIVVVLLAAGGWYFFRNYDIDGLDGVSIAPKGSASDEWRFSAPFSFISTQTGDDEALVMDESLVFSPSDIAATTTASVRQATRNLRIASWALDGFGETKLASALARRNLVRIVRQFDVICLQQIPADRLDLVPRMVDVVNEGSLSGGGQVYDFVLSPPTGPREKPEQLAILFNPERVRVDRSQTYTVADPDDQLTYDPLVAWFRANVPAGESASWTFTIVNLRIDLARAPAEVALLGNLFAAIRKDGRGEDDVLMTGLFQADDAYLLPIVAGPSMRAAVTSTPTDVYSRHQTSNILYDRDLTAEAVGSGGVVDFLRVYNLSLDEATAVTSHLPVFAEFSPLEGTPLAVRSAASAPATAFDYPTSSSRDFSRSPFDDTLRSSSR